MLTWMPKDNPPPPGRRVLAKDEARGYFAIGVFETNGEFEQVTFAGAPMGVGFYPTHWAEVGADQ